MINGRLYTGETSPTHSVCCRMKASFPKDYIEIWRRSEVGIGLDTEDINPKMKRA